MIVCQKGNEPRSLYMTNSQSIFQQVLYICPQEDIEPHNVMNILCSKSWKYGDIVFEWKSLND